MGRMGVNGEINIFEGKGLTIKALSVISVVFLVVAFFVAHYSVVVNGGLFLKFYLLSLLSVFYIAIFDFLNPRGGYSTKPRKPFLIYDIILALLAIPFIMLPYYVVFTISNLKNFFLTLLVASCTILLPVTFPEVWKEWKAIFSKG